MNAHPEHPGRHSDRQRYLVGFALIGFLIWAPANAMAQFDNFDAWMQAMRNPPNRDGAAVGKQLDVQNVADLPGFPVDAEQQEARLFEAAEFMQRIVENAIHEDISTQRIKAHRAKIHWDYYLEWWTLPAGAAAAKMALPGARNGIPAADMDREWQNFWSRLRSRRLSARFYQGDCLTVESVNTDGQADPNKKSEILILYEGIDANELGQDAADIWFKTLMDPERPDHSATAIAKAFTQPGAKDHWSLFVEFLDDLLSRDFSPKRHYQLIRNNAGRLLAARAATFDEPSVANRK